MPNISFDIFYDNDILNFTATRSQGIPKVKPAWKVRTAPKLPPKELPEAEKTAKPTRPNTKTVPKPTIQPRSAPKLPKKAAPTLQGSTKTTDTQKSAVNGASTATK